MSTRRETISIDPRRIGLLHGMRFDSAGEPIYALMVTGKDDSRRAFATNAIIGFLAQTYGNRRLVIVNHGDYEFEIAGPAAERVVEVRAGSGFRVGVLRNLALDEIPPDALWVQWDDDDWRHPALIAEQHAVLTGRGVDACLLRWQIKYAFARNAAWSDVWVGGFAGTLMTRNFPEIRYPDAPFEDTVYGREVKRRYRHCDWDNPPEYYIRLIHSDNTCSDDHFGVTNHGPDEWQVSPEAANYLRTTLSLYEHAVSAPRPESGTPARSR